jgi:hypothetical protein
MTTPPIAQFPVDRAAPASLLRHRNEAPFLCRPACLQIAKRLVVETHDARLRFSASPTVGRLGESDVVAR